MGDFVVRLSFLDIAKYKKCKKWNYFYAYG